MKVIITLAALVISTSTMSTPVLAGTSAGYGMGGQFSQFDPVVAQYNKSGTDRGPLPVCLPCTLFLGIRNVCVDRNAELLFHAGHDRGRNVSAKWTSHMLAAYKPKLREYLVSNHYVGHAGFSHHFGSRHDCEVPLSRVSEVTAAPRRRNQKF
jgi:hypothetical protein